MKSAIFWVVALLCLVFNAFNLYELIMMSLYPAEHFSTSEYPPEMIEMIMSFPEWKRLMWTTTVFIGVIGAIALVLRRPIAERALWATAVLLTLGVMLDYTMLDGATGYGPNGIVFNGIVIVIHALFALYATHARRQGMFTPSTPAGANTDNAD